MSQADDAAGGHATFMRRHCHRIPKFFTRFTWSRSPVRVPLSFCFLFRILSFGQVWAKLGGATSNLEDYRFIWVATKYVPISIAIDWSFPDWTFGWGQETISTTPLRERRPRGYGAAGREGWNDWKGLHHCWYCYGMLQRSLNYPFRGNQTLPYHSSSPNPSVDIAMAYCRGH